MISENVVVGGNSTIHPLAYIEDNVQIGSGVEIGPFCIIREGVVIGDNCRLTAYCELRKGVTVGNNTTFGSRCTISAGATVGDDVSVKYAFVLADTPDLTQGDIKSVGSIGDGALIGANVTLMPGFSIGEKSVIGACSQVRADVPPNEVWFGNPAKPLKRKDEK